MKGAPPRIRFLIATHDVLFLKAASATIELVPSYAERLREAYAG